MQKPKTIHRKRLFGGRQTAEQVHQQHAFPKSAKCRCGRRPLVRAITFAEYADARKFYPEIERMDPNAVSAILVQLRVGADQSPRACVRLGIAYACKECAPVMERTLAKLPSWILVEINRGPGPDRAVVGVA